MVFAPFHYGYWDEPEGDEQDGRGRAANELTITQWDAASKQPSYKTAAARVTKIEDSGGRPSPAPTNTGSKPVLDGLVGDPPEEVKKRNANNKNVPEERKDRWNWDSADQVKAAATTVDLSLEKTSMDYLKLIDHEFAKALLAYREVRSGLSTYGEKFFEPTVDGREVYLNGRLYPSWGMCAADTGRMSCSSPNVQNIPNKSRLGELRKCIVAPEGRRLIKADYSQIELRIVAKIAGEEKMLEAYRKGEDLHAATARSITGREEVTKEDRQLAKAVNFGLLYGQGVQGLREYARNSYGVRYPARALRRPKTASCCRPPRSATPTPCVPSSGLTR